MTSKETLFLESHTGDTNNAKGYTGTFHQRKLDTGTLGNLYK
nr:B162 [uncultured bacterium]ART36584.1 C632 [uncultured bacterium]ART40338.1 K766 [uncultured bacterium]ART40919.1 L375 [uncultured bacterium]